MLTKQEALWSPGGEQQGGGTQEARSATWLAVSGFMAMRLVSGFSLAHRSDLGSFLWHTHRSVKMDSSEKDSGRLVGHMDWRLLFPFGLS